MPLQNVFIKGNVKAMESFAEICCQGLTSLYLTAVLADGRKSLSLLSQMIYLPAWFSAVTNLFCCSTFL